MQGNDILFHRLLHYPVQKLPLGLLETLLRILLLALQETKIASNDKRISPEVLNIKLQLQIMEVEHVQHAFTLSNAFEKKSVT